MKKFMILGIFLSLLQSYPLTAMQKSAASLESSADDIARMSKRKTLELSKGTIGRLESRHRFGDVVRLDAEPELSVVDTGTSSSESPRAEAAISIDSPRVAVTSSEESPRVIDVDALLSEPETEKNALDELMAELGIKDQPETESRLEVSPVVSAEVSPESSQVDTSSSLMEQLLQKYTSSQGEAESSLKQAPVERSTSKTIDDLDVSQLETMLRSSMRQKETATSEQEKDDLNKRMEVISSAIASKKWLQSKKQSGSSHGTPEQPRRPEITLGRQRTLSISAELAKPESAHTTSLIEEGVPAVNPRSLRTKLLTSGTRQRNKSISAVTSEPELKKSAAQGALRGVLSKLHLGSSIEESDDETKSVFSGFFKPKSPKESETLETSQSTLETSSDKPVAERTALLKGSQEKIASRSTTDDATVRKRNIIANLSLRKKKAHSGVDEQMNIFEAAQALKISPRSQQVTDVSLRLSPRSEEEEQKSSQDIRVAKSLAVLGLSSPSVAPAAVKSPRALGMSAPDVGSPASPTRSPLRSPRSPRGVKIDDAALAAKKLEAERLTAALKAQEDQEWVQKAVTFDVEESLDKPELRHMSSAEKRKSFYRNFVESLSEEDIDHMKVNAEKDPQEGFISTLQNKFMSFLERQKKVSKKSSSGSSSDEGQGSIVEGHTVAWKHTGQERPESSHSREFK